MLRLDHPRGSPTGWAPTTALRAPAPQYLSTDGSTSCDHASIPPSTLYRSTKPCSRKCSAALRLELPWWQMNASGVAFGRPVGRACVQGARAPGPAAGRRARSAGGRTHVDPRAGAGIATLLQGAHVDRLDRLWRHRQMDREAFAVRRAGPVDAGAARALRAGDVEVHLEAVGARDDVVRACLAQLELRLEAAVDDEEQLELAGVGERRAHLLDRRIGDRQRGRRAVRFGHAEHAMQFARIEHRLHDVGTADQV